MEFQYPLELAKAILTRETVKKELTQQSQVVWEKRAVLADLKRKCPSFGEKNDEELLIDKERPAKRLETTLVLCSRLPLFLTNYFLRRVPLKLRTNDAGLPPARVEVAMRPRDRAALIREQIESHLARQKELDHHWDDQIDASYCHSFASITHLRVCLECVPSYIRSLCVALVQVYTTFVGALPTFRFRRGSSATAA